MQLLNRQTQLPARKASWREGCGSAAPQTSAFSKAPRESPTLRAAFAAAKINEDIELVCQHVSWFCFSEALASSDLQPPQLLQLCQSLPVDMLNDMPPSFVLLVHEQQQQQQQGASSLLLSLAAAMKRHCSSSVPSGSSSSPLPAEAAAAPELAVAILSSEVKILAQLRQVSSARDGCYCQHF